MRCGIPPSASRRACGLRARRRGPRPQPRCRTQEGPCRRRPAGVHRAAAMPFGRAPAVGRGLATRDQVRRLPRPGPHRGGPGGAPYPQGAGLDGPASAPSPGPAPALPDAIIDGEIVALTAEGAPDFAALQAAIADGRTDDLVFFGFDLLHAGAEDLRPLKLAERKDRLRALLPAYRRTATALRRALRHGRRSRPALGLQAVAGGDRLQAGQRPVPVWSQRDLDQGQVPRVATNWSSAPGPIPAGSSAP